MDTLSTNKRILDACCGSRMMHFDRTNPDVLFGDCRAETITVTDRSHGKADGTRTIVIAPDTLLDFRALPFADGTFHLVALDPPHVERGGEDSWLVAKYGKLAKDWRDDLRAGFAECFRVLAPNGTLVFKWNETHVKLSEVLALTPHQPIFGNTSGRKAGTHWLVFMKPAAASAAPTAAPAANEVPERCRKTGRIPYQHFDTYGNLSVGYHDCAGCSDCAPTAAPATGVVGRAPLAHREAARDLSYALRDLGLPTNGQTDYAARKLMLATFAALATPAPAVTEWQRGQWNPLPNKLEHQLFQKVVDKLTPADREFLHGYVGRLRVAATPPAPGPGAAAGTGEAHQAAWVSVKERLPEQRGYVLVCQVDKHGPYVMVARFEPEWHYDAENGDGEAGTHPARFLDCTQSLVTHWQPMPAPPVPEAAAAAPDADASN